MHTEILSWSATAPGAAGAAATALTGDSLTVKNSRGSGSPRIVDLWAMQQTSGFQQIAFPSGHDTTRGYRYGTEAGDTSSKLPALQSLKVESQELLTITVAGSATAGDVELGCALVHYPDLAGVNDRALTVSGLSGKVEKLTTIFCTITGTAAGYTGGELITAESNLLLANRDYAILGGNTTVDCLAVTIIGPDTGYARIAFPGADQDADEVSGYFVKLAAMMETALIPVINSGNREATTVGIVQDENNVSVVVTLFLALLRK